MRLLRNFLRDATGATAVEYGLITGLIAISLIGGASIYGNSISNMFYMLSNKVDVH